MCIYGNMQHVYICNTCTHLYATCVHKPTTIYIYTYLYATFVHICNMCTQPTAIYIYTYMQHVYKTNCNIYIPLCNMCTIYIYGGFPFYSILLTVVLFLCSFNCFNLFLPKNKVLKVLKIDRLGLLSPGILSPLQSPYIISKT